MKAFKLSPVFLSIGLSFALSACGEAGLQSEDSTFKGSSDPLTGRFFLTAMAGAPVTLQNTVTIDFDASPACKEILKVKIDGSKLALTSVQTLNCFAQLPREALQNLEAVKAAFQTAGHLDLEVDSTSLRIQGGEFVFAPENP